METNITINAFPFDGKRIDEVVRAGRKFEIRECNHGHSYHIIMDQNIIDVEDYEKSLMAFIKFIQEEIENCNPNGNPEQEKEIADFITMILKRIYHTIKTLASYGERIVPEDIRACLGQKTKYGDIYLYDVIELILNEVGYMHIPGTFGEIQKINSTPTNLTQSIDEILKKLNEEPNVSLGSK